MTVGWQTAVGLTLLTEDAVEWVLAWLRWWSDRQLDVHQFSPCGVSVHTELLNSLLDAKVDVIDGVVERWNYNENSEDGKSRASGGNSYY